MKEIDKAPANKELQPEENTLFGGLDDFSIAFAIYSIWFVAPVLHGVGWPLARVIVSTFFSKGWIELAQVTHLLGSLILAYCGLYVFFRIAFECLFRKLRARLNSQ